MATHCKNYICHRVARDLEHGWPGGYCGSCMEARHTAFEEAIAVVEGMVLANQPKYPDLDGLARLGGIIAVLGPLRAKLDDENEEES